MSLEAMLMNPKRRKKAKKAKKARRKQRSAAQKAARRAQLAGKKAKKVKKSHKRKYHKKAKHVKAVVTAPKRRKARRSRKAAKVKNIRRTRKYKLMKVYPGAHVRIKNPRKRRKHRKNPQFDLMKIAHYAAGAGIAIILPKVTLDLLSKIPVVGKVAKLAKGNLIGRLAVRGLMIYGGNYVQRKTKFKDAGKALMISSVALAAYELADNFLGLSQKLPLVSYLGLGEVEMEGEEYIGEIEMAGIEESMNGIEMNGIEQLDGFGADSNQYVF